MKVKKVAEGCVEYIKYFFDQTRGKKAIVELNTNNSFVAAKLCCEAIGKENVIGIIMPIERPFDISNQIQAAKTIGIEYIVINVEEPYCAQYNTVVTGFFSKICKGFGSDEEIDKNIKSRLKANMLYSVADMYIDSRVCNTLTIVDNFAKLYTKYGENVGDFAPLSLLTYSEVIRIGKYYNIGKALIHNLINDSRNHREALLKYGVSYWVIEWYLRNYHNGKKVTSNNIWVNDEDLKTISDMANEIGINFEEIPGYIPNEEYLMAKEKDDEIRVEQHCS